MKALLAHLKKEKSTSKAAAPQQEENVPREESLYLSIALKKIPEHVKAKPIRMYSYFFKSF